MKNLWLALGLGGIALVEAVFPALAQEPSSTPTAQEKHVVIVVWDGLRPDSITEEATPTLAKLAREGVFFTHHHSVYPSSTEVNGTAIATGCYPSHSGIIGNREYRPGIDPFRSIATEEETSIRAGDALTGGKYLRVPTLAESMHAAGWRTDIAGTKQVVVLQDRALRADAGKLDEESIDLFSGKVLPEEADHELDRTLGAGFPPTVLLPNVDEDAWTTHALTRALWKDTLPKLSVLWLSDPDFTQHKFGPSSPQALRALASCDGNLAAVLSTLESRGWRDSTDVFVVSDHGFSTIGHQVNIAKTLKDAGFEAYRSFPSTPKDGQVMVVGLGGVVYLYVIGHDAATIQRLVAFLQKTEYAGVIFTRDAPLPGTFPLGTIHTDSPDAPDLAVAMRWNDDKNANGLPGEMYSDGERKAGQGNHASLSRFELHNTLVANGPSFQKGFRDELPSANTDLAPTIARILGLPNAPHMDGRDLNEALVHPDADHPVIPPKTERLEAESENSGTPWKQYLQVTHYEGVDYLDEGNAVLPSPTTPPTAAN